MEDVKAGKTESEAYGDKEDFSQNQKKLAKSFRVCASGELEETAFGQTFPANIAGKPTTKTGFFCFTVRYPCFPTSDSVSTQPGSQSGCGFQYTFCKLPPLSSACASLSANLCIPFRPNTISWNGFPRGIVLTSVPYAKNLTVCLPGFSFTFAAATGSYGHCLLPAFACAQGACDVSSSVLLLCMG